MEAVHILGVCRGLRQLGFEVEIVSPPGVEVTEAAGGDRAGRSRWGWVARNLPQVAFELLEIAYNLAAVPRLVRRCRELRPAFLYERYALYNLAGVIAGRLTHIPLILEVNDTVDTDRLRYGKRLAMKPLARWFERRIFRGAAGIAAVSGYLREQAIRTGASPERVCVTPNAVELERFNPETARGSELRKKLGWEGCAVIGFVGSFARWHGVDLLIRAFAALARDYPEARLLLVGDGAELEPSRALTSELRIADRVHFAGRVSHSEVPDAISAMDVGVMPASNVFGSPMKVFEYMAMGKPALGPRLGPLEEAITHGKEGFLFEPGSVDGLTECLRALLEDPDLRREMGRAARNRVVTRHLWVHNAEAVVALLPGADRVPAGEPMAARV